jgi:hypothetical protein
MHHLRLDGVCYDICAKQREDGRFTVAWVCLQCCEQGPPIPAANSMERAVSFAQIGLRAHHGLVHRHLNECLADDGSATPAVDDDQENDATQATRTAYRDLCAAFEKLCSADALIRNCYGYHAKSEASIDKLAAACRSWNESACDFDAAIEAYSADLRDRTAALEARLDGSNHAQGRSPSIAPRRNNQ